MKCTLCKKQDGRKAETSFIISLDTHSKDVKKLDAILVGKHFQNKCHVFNKHPKFITINQLTSITRSNRSHVTNAVKYII